MRNTARLNRVHKVKFPVSVYGLLKTRVPPEFLDPYQDYLAHPDTLLTESEVIPLAKPFQDIDLSLFEEKHNLFETPSTSIPVLPNWCVGNRLSIYILRRVGSRNSGTSRCTWSPIILNPR